MHGRELVINEPESTLSVSIPNELPLRPLMGDTLVLPCHFQDNTVNDPGAPTIAPLSHRIKWSLITKEKSTNILVSLGHTSTVSLLECALTLGWTQRTVVQVRSIPPRVSSLSSPFLSTGINLTRKAQLSALDGVSPLGWTQRTVLSSEI
ncbi:hypothetical protein cypCar_00020903 [Cyprinus carpio]|nr:hypothetical protein cypCar_00020903 [Cyprinus carpio]